MPNFISIAKVLLFEHIEEEKMDICVRKSVIQKISRIQRSADFFLLFSLIGLLFIGVAGATHFYFTKSMARAEVEYSFIGSLW